MRVRYTFLAALLFAGFGCGAQPPSGVAAAASRSQTPLFTKGIRSHPPPRPAPVPPPAPGSSAANPLHISPDGV
jgi:hypothetical protein